MGNRQNAISLIGTTNARSTRRHFGIRQSDRLSHMYLIGKTGTGKTTLLETLMRQDLLAGRGFALLDPHGDLADRIATAAKSERPNQTVHVDLPDANQPFGYNPLLQVSAPFRPLVASGLMDVFRKMWPDAWGVRMEHILRNALLALLDQPAATLPDILRLLTSGNFRQQTLAHVVNEQVRLFWRDEFPRYSFRNQADGIAPIQNKVGAFLADPRLRRFLVPTNRGLRLREIMDQGQILLINLAQGRIGNDSSALLGALLLTSLGSAAFSRATASESTRRPFFIYVDEFQNFTTLALANMLSELRKFGCGLVIAHQYLQQLEPDIAHAVIGNIGTLIAFRLGAHDAGLIAREFEPQIEAMDLLHLPNHHICLRLLIDGMPSRAFTGTTFPADSQILDSHSHD